MAAAALGVLLAESAGRRDGHEADGFRGSGASRRDLARREVRRLSLRPRWNVGRLGQPGRDRATSTTSPRGACWSCGIPGPARLASSPDGSLVTLWSRVPDSGRRRPGRCRVGGSHDGRPASAGVHAFRKASPSSTGRPTADASCTTRQRQAIRCSSPSSTRRSRRPTIYVARPGVHSHFPVWSPDGAFIYFVQGLPLDEADVWRIRPTGGEPERLTFHHSRVTFPTLLDNRTLLYLATDAEGSGPWIYAMDVERRVPHRISTGVEEYTSLAASADGRRLVATLSRSTAGLWRVPIADRVIDESGATPISLPTGRGSVAARGAWIHRLSCPESRNRWPLEARRRRGADRAVEWRRWARSRRTGHCARRSTPRVLGSEHGDGRNCT